ncbi:SET [Glarea lozoyensis ATCC 20868]|uniref:SET n=1 Tax=Glarea lozoyensis (strain ATCC 20868 / MF5171) TaxID=1116229 RepID=S3D2D7_GLAL2|nr:SET [Glarea lozoyensis ATCC 20868]EPE31990.1 SET [Glarea lozoyensis ATCC 20868]
MNVFSPQQDRAEFNGVIHENPELCTDFLSTIKPLVTLRIQESTICGGETGLFVCEDVPQGADVFRSTPLLTFAGWEGNVQWQKFICAHCFRFSRPHFLPFRKDKNNAASESTMKLCAGCKSCGYCSQKCQLEAWRFGHKSECSIFARQPNFIAIQRTMLRILIQYKSGELLTPCLFKALLALKSDEEAWADSDAYSDYLSIAQIAKHASGTRLEIESVWDILCKVLTNATAVQPAEVGTDGVYLGTTLDPVISLLRHSCEPNVFIFFEGNQLRVRSLKPLKAGEEISRSYTWTEDSPRCQREDKELSDWAGADTERTKSLARAQQQASEYFQSQPSISGTNIDVDCEIIERTMKQMARGVLNEDKWPDNLQPMPQILLQLSKYYLAQNDSVESLKLSLRALLAQDRRFGPYWANQLAEWLTYLVRLTPTTTEDLTKLPFVTFGDLMDVISGYSREATLVVAKVFGTDTSFSKTLQKRDVEHSIRMGTPNLSSVNFLQRFKNAQGKFLLWAGIDVSRELLLSDEWVSKA